VGRYTGPRERLSRRAGIDLELKGSRRFAGKAALERRSAPPGQHGASGFRRRPSTYGLQLQAKQNAKHYYGVRERQFRNYMKEAQRGGEGVTGERLLTLLELRLDNVIYRLGFAATRAQARQFVTHRHVDVNGRRCNIPSRRLAPGDIVTIRAESPVRAKATEATELAERVPAWLLADPEALIGRVVAAPARADIQAPIDEQMIVEFYSRV